MLILQSNLRKILNKHKADKKGFDASFENYRRRSTEVNSAVSGGIFKENILK